MKYNKIENWINYNGKKDYHLYMITLDELKGC